MYSPALSGGAARSRVRTPKPNNHQHQQQQQRITRTDSLPTSYNGNALHRPRSWNDLASPVRLELPARTESDRLLMEHGHDHDQRKPSSTNLAKITNAVLYGVINSILTIPCMYGYAAIIFSHHDFVTYMPSLSKLVMFSSVVHQVMFTLLSSLPFAIGQVQDAGLIFLSAIATSICTTLGASATLEAKIATVVVTIGLATAALGVCLVLIGRFKLAGLVSYLPMPVVGGYLAFIGLFCLYAGLSLSTGLVINDFSSLLQLWYSPELIVLCIPGILGGVVLLVVSQRCDNSFALPGCILGMPLLFFVALWLSGSDIQQARDYGWISPDAPPASFLQMWDLFDFSQVHWSVLPSQITTWLGMVFVVAFSSCLDVAAIEMDMGQQLDINHELSSVGWSNVVSGLFGGYTGSYIFSQTIFTYRAKTDSRIVGVCVILSEFAIVLLPLSVMSYVPRFFFAATLIFIAIDLLVEWLVHVYHKVLLREYIVLWASFIAINWVSLELGMLLGIGFAILNFLLGYAQVNVVTRAFKRSSAVRKYAARTLLAQKRDAIVLLELHGYLFFGSSVRILEDVQKAVHVRTKHAPPVQLIPSFASTGNKTKTKHGGGGSVVLSGGLALTPLAQPQPQYEVMVECLDGSAAQEPEGLPTEFVVMDFSRVSGMDATAARSSLMILQQLCKRHGITVLFADALPEIQRMLLQNEIAESGDFFPTADIALEICENRLLAQTSSGSQLDAYTDRDLGIRTLLHRFIGEPDDSMFFQGIDRFCRRQVVLTNHVFYRVGEFPDHFVFLATGRVALFMNQDGSSSHEKTLQLLEHVIPGAMFGEVDFFGRQCRLMGARAMEKCVVYEMSRANYELLERENPQLWNRLRDVVIMSMALAITNTTSINSCNNAATVDRDGTL